VFAAEQEHTFERTSTCDSLAADRRARSFRTVTVGRESLVLVRGRDAVVHTFLNVCTTGGSRIG